MKNCIEVIIEALDAAKEKRYKKELDDLLKEEPFNHGNPNEQEIWSLWRNVKKNEIYLYCTDTYYNLFELWKKSKLYPEVNGRYLTFQLSKESALAVCDKKTFKKLKLIDKTK